MRSVPRFRTRILRSCRVRPTARTASAPRQMRSRMWCGAFLGDDAPVCARPFIVHGMDCPLRALSLALLALANVGLLTVNAETRATAAVDFSGRWVLVSATPSRPGYEQFWLGTEATITQTPSTLSIRRLTPLPQRDARFALGGDETQNEYVVNGQKLVRNSRATWNGNSLLISTDTALPDGQTYLSNILRWSLDADGMLVIGDTEICGRGECPSVLTTVKFRKAD